MTSAFGLGSRGKDRSGLCSAIRFSAVAEKRPDVDPRFASPAGATFGVLSRRRVEKDTAPPPSLFHHATARKRNGRPLGRGGGGSSTTHTGMPARRRIPTRAACNGRDAALEQWTPTARPRDWPKEPPKEASPRGPLRHPSPSDGWREKTKASPGRPSDGEGDEGDRHAIAEARQGRRRRSRIGGCAVDDQS